MIKNNWFLIGFGATRTHSRAFWGVASKVQKSMVCAVLLKGPKGGLGENREGISANRTPVEAKQGVRSKKCEKALVFDRFWKVPRGGDKLTGGRRRFKSV